MSYPNQGPPGMPPGYYPPPVHGYGAPMPYGAPQMPGYGAPQMPMMYPGAPMMPPAGMTMPPPQYAGMAAPRVGQQPGIVLPPGMPPRGLPPGMPPVRSAGLGHAARGPPPSSSAPTMHPPPGIAPPTSGTISSVPMSSAPPPMALPTLSAVKAREDCPDWLPPSAHGSMTVFVGGLPKEEDASDEAMVKLFECCGGVLRWDRRRSVVDGKALGFGYVTFGSGLGGVRALRLLQGLEMGNDCVLEIRVGAKETAIVEDVEDARTMHTSMGPAGPPGDGDSAAPVNEDEEAEKLGAAKEAVAAHVAELLAAALAKPAPSSGKEGEDGKDAESSGVNTAVVRPQVKPKLSAAELVRMSDEERLEKTLMEDVEQYRADQRLRDAENDKQRRQKFKECGREAWRAKNAREEAEEAAANAASAPAAATSSSAAVGSASGPRLDPVGAAAAHPMASAAASLGGASGGPDAFLSGGGASTGRRDNRPAWMVESEQASKRTKVEEPGGATVITAAPMLSLAMASSKTKKPASSGLKTKAAFGEEAAAARPLVKLTDESEAARDKRIAESLPKDRDELFAWPIAWNALEANPDALDHKIRKWVTSKMVEYLGETEETTLVEFVVSKLKQRTVPGVLLSELEPVLEADADVFVTKLWKVLAFHATKLNEDL